MSSTLKAVASFSEAGWKPLAVGSYCGDEWDADEVFAEWHESEDHPVTLHDPEVEWRKIETHTTAYRINGNVLLVIAWDYDGAPDGGGYSVESWNMGAGQ